MPTYEFRCPDGHEFERFYRKISDAPADMVCPECGKPAVRKLSGGAGLVFKGSGFYLTDYGKNAHRKSGSADAPSGESGGESKSDAAKSGDSSAAAGSAGASSSGTGGGEAKAEKAGDTKPAPPSGGGSGGSEARTKSSGPSTGGSSSGSSGKTDK